MINIDKFKSFIEMIANKPQSGFPFSIAKFNNACKRAQMELYSKGRDHFEETEEVTDEMTTFLIPSTLPIDTNGQAQYPSNYSYTTSSRYTYYKNNIPKTVDIKYIRNSEVGNFLSSQISYPTKRYPVLSYYDTYMQFYPKDLGYCLFDYLRLPTDPIWAYTTVNNRPVYDPGNSVNLEFDEDHANEIAFMVCSFMGANMREQQLIQYSEALKQQSGNDQ